MATFKPMARQQYSSQERVNTVINTVLEPNCGLNWINSKLSSTTNETHLRLLPYFDETGEAYLPFDPNGRTIANGVGLDCLGMAFLPVECADLYINKARHVFVTTIKPLDSHGRQVPAAKNSPANNVLSQLYWTLVKNNMLVERGYAPIVPEDFSSLWRDKVIESASCIPKSLLLVRALPLMLDGQSVQNPAAGVYAIPRSAEAGFLANITEKRDPNGPLTPNNMPAHWNVMDPRNGYILRVKKIAKSATSANPQGQYGAQNHQPQHGQQPDSRQKDKGKIDYVITTIEPYPLSEDYLRWLATEQKSWEDVIHYPTIEESIQMLVELLGPRVVDFGLRSTPYSRYLPPGVAGSAADIIADTRKPSQIKALPVAVHSYAPPPRQDNYDQQQIMHPTAPAAYNTQQQQPATYAPSYAPPAAQQPQVASYPQPQAAQAYPQPQAAPAYPQPQAAPAYAQPQVNRVAPQPQVSEQPQVKPQAPAQSPAVPFQEQLPHMGDLQTAPMATVSHMYGAPRTGRPAALPQSMDISIEEPVDNKPTVINVDGQERVVRTPPGANAIQDRLARLNAAMKQ